MFDFPRKSKHAFLAGVALSLRISPQELTGYLEVMNIEAPGDLTVEDLTLIGGQIPVETGRGAAFATIGNTGRNSLSGVTVEGDEWLCDRNIVALR